MTINRKIFFDGIRQGPFPGKLTADQVKGTTAILDEWDRRALTDLRCLAYMLGTVKWETDHTMQPIREKGSAAYLKRMYDPLGDRPSLAKRNGNTTPGDGAKYCGRGFVQLTWKNNYATMTKLLKAAGFDVDLVSNPDLAMRSDVAAFILFDGMFRGSFTGKRLGDYFNATKTDWINARRIINGTDRAAEIAAISKQFYVDLAAAS
jgi:putative chitinase